MPYVPTNCACGQKTHSFITLSCKHGTIRQPTKFCWSPQINQVWVNEKTSRRHSNGVRFSHLTHLKGNAVKQWKTKREKHNISSLGEKNKEGGRMRGSNLVVLGLVGKCEPLNVPKNKPWACQAWGLDRNERGFLRCHLWHLIQQIHLIHLIQHYWSRTKSWSRVCETGEGVQITITPPPPAHLTPPQTPTLGVDRLIWLSPPPLPLQQRHKNTTPPGVENGRGLNMPTYTYIYANALCLPIQIPLNYSWTPVLTLHSQPTL